MDDMSELIVFYLEGCPYCRNARKAYEELIAENDAYKNLPVKWVEESRNAALADKYDYYRVPSIYCDDKKLYEASPSDSFDVIKTKIKAAMDAVM